MGKTPKEISWLEKLSISITNWMGSTQSLVVHTILFVVIFGLYFIGFEFDKILLILTTLVSLEAIYLSLFIQMTVNRNTQSLESVEDDIDEIQEGVEDLQEDVGEIEGDVDKLHVGVAEISKDVDEISEDVDQIHEHVEDLSEDMDDITGDVEPGEPKPAEPSLATIQQQLEFIVKELDAIKKKTQ